MAKASKVLGSKIYWPLYEEAEKLKRSARGACWRAAPSLVWIVSAFITRPRSRPSLRHHAQAGRCCLTAVPIRFPKLRVGFLEGGRLGVPFFVDRLDGLSATSAGRHQREFLVQLQPDVTATSIFAATRKSAGSSSALDCDDRG